MINLDEKKEFVLDYIKMVGEFMENNFETMGMLVELDAYKALKNFLNFNFTDNVVTAILFYYLQ